MLSEQTIRELRVELANLLSRAEAIQAILSGATSWHAKPAKRRRKLIGSENQAVLAPRGIDGKSTSTTFADRVRLALRHIGRPARSRDVVKWMESRDGAKYTDRPLGIAVSSELFRMAKRHLGVRRESRGRYCYEETGPIASAN